LQLAFDFHLKYEQIHPFENWNGRTWRFLMNKILIQNWMLPMIVFTENKQSYFNAIKSCESWNKRKYYKFMLEQYKKTLDQIKI
jgi:Fic family protein